MSELAGGAGAKLQKQRQTHCELHRLLLHSHSLAPRPSQSRSCMRGHLPRCSSCLLHHMRLLRPCLRRQRIRQGVHTACEAPKGMGKARRDHQTLFLAHPQPISLTQHHDLMACPKNSLLLHAKRRPAEPDMHAPTNHKAVRSTRETACGCAACAPTAPHSEVISQPTNCSPCGLPTTMWATALQSSAHCLLHTCSHTHHSCL